MIQGLPDVAKAVKKQGRMKTGAIQFGNEWPGVFVVGQDCMQWELNFGWLKQLIKDSQDTKALNLIDEMVLFFRQPYVDKKPFNVYADEDTRLISQEYPDGFGIGIAFLYKGDECRVGVKLKNDVSIDDIKLAWKKLQKAMIEPDNPESKVVRGMQRLTGNEITI